MSKFIKGTRVIGTVSEIREYGALVSVGDESGLLHSSRLRGGSPGAQRRRLHGLAIGGQVEVDVLDVQGSGKRAKVTLSELWQDDRVVAEVLAGTSVAATVCKAVDSGLIVVLADGPGAGYDGFVHVSELGAPSRDGREKQLAFAKPGDPLTLEVLRVGRDGPSGWLSIKLSEAKASVRLKLSTTYAAGTKHTGTVRKRVEGGWVVSFGEFSGFLPERELAGTNASSIRVGGGVKTKVKEIDSDLNITLTRHGL